MERDSFQSGFFQAQHALSRETQANDVLLADLQRGEGRVVFAGDHTCLYTGWAQGALESAHFATAEVIAAARGLIEPTT
ncbi:FAD-dependent oxidoreductase [Sorangium sp. So ce1000]|uniref:FAD-dependent oxidoreductase n=1 Tax=Sorangium sp. So ce1000 TaxID=3133325 RepID=UPI003F615C43